MHIPHSLLTFLQHLLKKQAHSAVEDWVKHQKSDFEKPALTSCILVSLSDWKKTESNPTYILSFFIKRA